MSFIFWSDVTFIYTMYYIIIYVICQIGNYLVDTYLFPRFYVRHSVCTEYCLYYKCGVLIYQLGAPYCTIPCNILPTWNKRAQLYKPDSLCLLCIFRTFFFVIDFDDNVFEVLYSVFDNAFIAFNPHSCSWDNSHDTGSIVVGQVTNILNKGNR